MIILTGYLIISKGILLFTKHDKYTNFQKYKIQNHKFRHTNTGIKSWIEFLLRLVFKTILFKLNCVCLCAYVCCQRDGRI